MSYRSRQASQTAMPMAITTMIAVGLSMFPLLCRDNRHV